MLRSGLSLLLVVSVAAGNLNGHNEPSSTKLVKREHLRFEEIVPESAWVVGVKRGSEAGRSERAELALFKLFAEPAFQRFVAPVQRMTAQAQAQVSTGSMNRSSYVPVSTITEMLSGGMGFAFGGLSYFEGVPTPGLTVSVDVTGREHAFIGFVERQLDRLPADFRDILIRGSFDYKGIHVETLGTAEHFGEICYTRLRNLFLVSSSRHFLVDTLDNYLGRSEQSVAQLASFQRAWDKIGRENPNYLLHINGEAIGAALGGIPLFRGLAQAMGIDSINSISLSGHLEGDRSRDLVYIDAPGPRRGMLASFTSKPLDPSAMGWAPPDATSCSLMHLSLSQAYTHFAGSTRQSILEMVPPENRNQVDSFIDQAMVWLPLNALGDIFEPMGDYLAYYVAPSRGGLVPSVVGAVPLKNPWRVHSGFEKLTSVLPEGSLKSTRYKDSKIYYVKLNLGGVVLQPAFTVCADRFMVADSVMTLKKAMSFATSEGPTLADTPEFQDSLNRLQGEPSEFSYTNIGSSVAGLYGTFAPVLAQQIDDQGLPLDGSALPNARVVAKHLGGQVSSTSIDEQGVLMESISPVGLAAIVESFDGMVAWFTDAGRGDALLTSLMSNQGPTMTVASAPNATPQGMVSNPHGIPGTLAGNPSVVAEESKQSSFQTHEGETLDLITDLPAERAEDILLEADDAFETTWLMFGLEMPEARLDLHVTSSIESYQQFGSQVDDDDDAVKSSVYGQFVSDQGGIATGYVIDDSAPSYTVILARQAAAEMALRRLPLGSDLPRWLVEGIACWMSRYQPDESHADWSREALTKAGGTLPLKSFFHPYTVSHRNILQAGLLIHFANDQAGSAEVKGAWESLRVVMGTGDRAEFEAALARFRMALEQSQKKVRALAMDQIPSNRFEVAGAQAELVSQSKEDR